MLLSLLPHRPIASPDISKIDWRSLRDTGGIRAVAFDKDNCLTLPYALGIHAPLQVLRLSVLPVLVLPLLRHSRCTHSARRPRCHVAAVPSPWRSPTASLQSSSPSSSTQPTQEALAQCIETFGRDKVAVVSNSAGSSDDAGGAEARALSGQLGIAVIEHGGKKPAERVGRAVLSHFGCEHEPHRVAMVGDRLYTDVLLGNRAGMFTVLTEPFTDKGDSAPAAAVRVLPAGRGLRDGDDGDLFDTAPCSVSLSFFFIFQVRRLERVLLRVLS